MAAPRTELPPLFSPPGRLVVAAVVVLGAAQLLLATAVSWECAGGPGTRCRIDLSPMSGIAYLLMVGLGALLLGQAVAVLQRGKRGGPPSP